MVTIHVFPDSYALTDAAIELFISLGCESILKQGSFSVALSGGSTPRKLYTGLASPENQKKLPWAAVQLFFGDERHVPPDHPDSNFRMVHETLLSKVPIPEGNIHRVKVELDARLAAFSYEEELRSRFEDIWPRFDLVLLGLGVDGHTASLFPGTAGLNEEQRWFIANFLPKRGVWRLTLTRNAINAGRKIVVLVSGLSKAGVLSEVLAGNTPHKQKPIQMISPQDGEMIWMLDRDAASQLPGDVLT